MMDFSWGSPLGIGAFFAGCGVFFYGFFMGLAAFNKSAREVSSGEKP